MKNIGFLCTALLFSSLSFSYTGTVQKIKGTKAIVEFEKNAKIREGDMVTTDMSTQKSSATSGGKYQNRDYSLEYTISMVSASANGASATTTSITTAFGFNFQNFEVGPLVSMTSGSSSSSSTTTSATAFGAFGRYNFTHNVSGEEWIFFAGGRFVQSSSSGGSSSTNMSALAGVDWFPIGNNVAFNFQLLFGQTSTTGGGSTTTMGIASGPVIYF